MSVLDLLTATDYARSANSQSNIGTATALAMKIRVNGALLKSMTAYQTRALLEIGSMAGVDRCSISIYRDGDVTPNEIYIRAHNGVGGQFVATGVDVTEIADGAFFVIYMRLGAGGDWNVNGFLADGTAAGSYTDLGNTNIGAADAANGKVSVGDSVDNPDSTTGPVGQVDGVAIYSAALTGDNRWSPPTAEDANILFYVPFDEGTGSTAANAVPGAEALTLSGADWETGGAWDGASSTEYEDSEADGFVIGETLATTWSTPGSPEGIVWGDSASPHATFRKLLADGLLLGEGEILGTVDITHGQTIEHAHRRRRRIMKRRF